jgi:SAM-dependent methyltransferase
MTNLIPRIEFLLQAPFRRRRKCPNCRAEDADLVARKHGVVRVRQCTGCLLYFTDPTYQSFLGPLYGGLYDAEGSTTRTPDNEELERLRATGFRGTDKDAHSRLERLAEIAPGPRLLEIGSSWGYFLAQAREHGFTPTGVEMDTGRREFGCSALEVRIVEGFDALGTERFDLIYSAHTLEHFTDFAGVLAALAELLTEDGLLAVEVPHFDLVGRGREALSTVGAVHPLGFTSAFFRRNLPAAGFDLLGFFERWEDVPAAAAAECSGGEVIFVARRVSEAKECA